MEGVAVEVVKKKGVVASSCSTEEGSKLGLKMIRPRRRWLWSSHSLTRIGHSLWYAGCLPLQLAQRGGKCSHRL